MNKLQKILLVFFITLVGGFITCGGNVIINGFINTGRGISEWLYIIWYIELFCVYILAVIFVRNRRNSSTSLLMKIILTIFSLISIFYLTWLLLLLSEEPGSGILILEIFSGIFLGGIIAYLIIFKSTD